MNAEPFVWYGLSHWVALALVAGVSAAAVLLARRWRGTGRREAVDWAVRLLVLVTVLPHHCQKLFVEGRALLDMCDLAGLAAIAALFTRHRLASALLFYWGLTLTPNALLTPALTEAYPSLRFVMFFAPHGAVVVAAAYSTWGLGIRMTWRLCWQAVAVTTCFLLFVFAWNVTRQTNYMFLRAKPSGHSVLDFLGPWPVYVVVLVVVTALLWALMTWPFERRK